MRLLWSGNNVSYKGNHFTLNNISIEPKPVQKNYRQFGLVEEANLL